MCVNRVSTEKSEIKIFLEQNFWDKIIFENKNNNQNIWDLFILKEKTETNKTSEKNQNLNNFLPKYSYTDEKIFINLEKIKNIFWINLFWNLKTFWAISKNFDDWIQVKILIK